MEVVGALVLAYLSLVSATPSGYGANGGAFAKAEGGALAGSYGEMPPIPTNGGVFSGSFSKSSSSSYSASSASASSNSYSYSGSGVFGGNGVELSSNGGCSSGNCQSTNLGNVQTYNSAKAGSAALAAANTGLPNHSAQGLVPCSDGDCLNKKPISCEGSNCDSTTSAGKLCTSGSCKTSTNTGTPSIDYQPNKCTSGQCNPSSSSINVPGSNDIYVDITEPPQSYPAGVNKFPGNAYTGSNSQTYSGNTKPASFLTTPKEDTLCTSPSCGTNKDAGSMYDGNKPSSYNVPIHGSYLKPPLQGSSCAYGNCAPTSSNSQTVPSPSRPSCTSGICAEYPSIVNTNNEPSKIPSDQQVSSTSTTEEPFFLPLGQTAGKPSQNHNSAHGVAATSGATIINGVKNKERDTSTPTSIPFKGSFGGPPGFLKPYDFNAPVSNPSVYEPLSPVGSYKPICTSGNCEHGTGHKPNYYPSGSTSGGTSCSYGNCGSQPGLTASPSGGSNYTPSQPSGASISAACLTGNCGSQNKPIPPSPLHDQSGAYKPATSSVGFGGPPGILKPYEFTKPSNAPPSYSNSESQYKPVTSSVPCASGNCAAQPSQPTPQYVQSPTYQPAGPLGVPNQVSCSSGNCGPQNSVSGASSVSSSNSPSTSQHFDQTNFNNYKPVKSPQPCSSGNCAAQPNQPTPQYGQNPSYKSTAPSGVPNQVLCSSGNCEALQGSHTNSVSEASSISSANSPSTSPYLDKTNSNSYKPVTSPLPCSSGNCAAQPIQPTPQYGQSPSYKPTGASGAHNDISCSSGNCAAQPIQPTPQYGQSPSYKPTGPSGAPNDISCSSGNCRPQHGSHTNSVTGASAISTSYSPNPLSSPSCTSLKCVSNPTNPQSQSGHLPTGSGGVYNPTSCPFGRCNTPVNQPTTTHGSPNPSASDHSYNPAPCSSGNCAPQQTNHIAPAGPIHPTTSCTYGNCGNKTDYTVNQHDQNGIISGTFAASSSNAVAYTGGFGGPPGLLKPYDDGKLIGNTYINTQHASPGPQEPTAGGIPSTFGKLGASTGLQANAASASTAGAYGNVNGLGGNQVKGGCNTCRSNNNGNFGSNVPGSNSLAFGGAHSGGYGSAGTFAGSSSSAYAGAATKGGYGRR